MTNPLFASMKQSILDGDSDAAITLAKQSLAEGIDPLEAINLGFLLGMNEIGEQFGAGQLFLPDVIMAAEAMKKATAILQPEMNRLGTQL